jgi:hypothetical protein
MIGVGSILCLAAWVLTGLTVGLETADLVGLHDDVQQENERLARIQQQWEESQQIRFERMAALNAFRAGRIDFDCVMDTFRDLSKRAPLQHDLVRLAYPERSDEECVGFEILIAVHGSILPRSERETFLRELVPALKERLKVEIPEELVQVRKAARPALDTDR